MNLLYKKKTPTPDFYRKKQIILNGKWNFAYNFADEEFLKIKPNFIINVPFCPESEFSGINVKKEIIKSCYYSKKFKIKKGNDKILLCFEAVNYFCKVYVNGNKAGEHKGGYTPFSFDITDYVKNDKNVLEVYCYSDVADKRQPSGKQCNREELYSVFYPRTTGIWQSVYIERVSDTYLEYSRINTSLSGNIDFELTTNKKARSITAEIFYGNKKVAGSTVFPAGNNEKIHITLKNPHLWSADTPNLYDVRYITEDYNSKKDICYGYFGVRDITVKCDKFLINGKGTFLNFVLNQGYYPGGIYTPKKDADVKRDIILSKKLGFNGARLHQKVFARKALYYADMLGFYVWGEYPSWGFDHTTDTATEYFLPEWKEAVARDINHPCIVTWCPLNENWEIDGKKQSDNFVRAVYDFTRKTDSSRPCVDVSWNYHVKTDIYDVHDYTTDIVDFEKKFRSFSDKVYDSFDQKYEGQPYMLSEFGGLKYSCEKNAFGYGDEVKSEEEFAEKIIKYYDVISKNKKIKGCCYTQLYDVFQEQNGLLFFNRKPKFSKKALKRIIMAIKKCGGGY